jgi:phosphogluconate dehydratase
MPIHSRIGDVTERIAKRSHDRREAYRERMARARDAGPRRATLSCGNLAHGFAACGVEDKAKLSGDAAANLAIVTSYNDMLSAHQPYEGYPDIIREVAEAAGAVAQVAGGVPAMCDGVTQGQEGMELSLFSRDTIAMGVGIALSHNMFDAAVFLGICDKIVPGLLIGSLAFGHLPAVFIPAGPMTTGLSNDEKAKTRQLYLEGKVGRAELLESESKSYHGPGTCTFYGTANSNQMLMEIMGLHLPGASFVNPNTPLRDALTRAAAKRALSITALGNEYTPVGEVIDERAIVNGIVGLLATGGSTNHTMHLVAIARAAGIDVTWDDFSELSDVVPLMTRVYPNGRADVNHFHAAGGMGFLIGSLIDEGLVHEDVRTVWGAGLNGYRGVGRGAARVARSQRAASGERALPGDRRAEGPVRQSRPRRHQGLGGEAGPPCDRGAGGGVLLAGGADGRLQGGLARPGLRRRGALPGAARQRHAGAAQADADARHPAGPRAARGACDGRAHVGRLRQGAGGDPRDARGGGRRPDRAHPRRRHHPRRCRCGHAGSAGAGSGMGSAHACG